MSKYSKELSGLITVLYTHFDNVAEFKHNKEENFIQIVPKDKFDTDQVIREITREVDELSDDSSYHYLTKIKENELQVYIRDLNEE